jgi:hypothetical protein
MMPARREQLLAARRAPARPPRHPRVSTRSGDAVCSPKLTLVFEALMDALGTELEAVRP